MTPRFVLLDRIDFDQLTNESGNLVRYQGFYWPEIPPSTRQATLKARLIFFYHVATAWLPNPG